MSEQSKRKEFFLLRWFKRLFFGPARELSFLEEEALQSPLRLVMKNFWSRRISRVAVVLFGIILLIVVVGPRFLPVDLSYQDNTQIHAAPGYNMMKVPDELKGNLRMIAPGTTYGVGVDKQGKVHTWGHLRVTNVITLEDIPQEVLDADIVDVAAGYDHIAALDSAGKLHIWGNTRLDQAKLPNDIANAMAAGENLHFTQLEAGNQ
ncbi:MAG TPA: peptide ABC transporter permease, partial [Clostridia bacterium]|nr:peptide ABC transporter permease [Clostridia bacterium]